MFYFSFYTITGFKNNQNIFFLNVYKKFRLVLFTLKYFDNNSKVFKYYRVE